MGRARLARLHGIATSYEPAPGRSVQIAGDTVVAVLAALGVDASTPHAVRTALAACEDGRDADLLPRTVVARPGRPPDLTGLPAGSVLRVETEAGATQDLGAPDPATLARLPLGIHELFARSPDGRSARAPLIVAPDRVPAPPAAATASWSSSTPCCPGSPGAWATSATSPTSPPGPGAPWAPASSS